MIFFSHIDNVITLIVTAVFWVTEYGITGKKLNINFIHF